VLSCTSAKRPNPGSLEKTRPSNLVVVRLEIHPPKKQHQTPGNAVICGGRSRVKCRFKFVQPCATQDPDRGREGTVDRNGGGFRN
jgi:hypothetical protein